MTNFKIGPRLPSGRTKLMIEPKAFFTTGHYKNSDRAPRYDPK